MNPPISSRRQFAGQICRAAAGATALSIAAHWQVANAQAFPARPLRIVVPFAPGGPTDLMARSLARYLTSSLGQSVVIDNKPGGGGVIAFSELMKSPADGYTLVMPSILAVTSPSLVKGFPFDMARDFQALTIVGYIPHVLVVRTESPWRSLAALLATGRRQTLTYASTGTGTSAHLAGAMLVERTGVPMTHVPYRGAAPATQDLLAGQVDTMFLDLTSAIPQINAGKLVPLAVASGKRSTVLPDVPAVAEQGYAGFDIKGWYGLLLRAGTPPAAIDRLYADVAAALRDPEINQAFRPLGIEVGGLPPNEFGAQIRTELEQWHAIINRLGIQAS